MCGVGVPVPCSASPTLAAAVLDSVIVRVGAFVVVVVVVVAVVVGLLLLMVGGVVWLYHRKKKSENVAPQVPFPTLRRLASLPWNMLSLHRGGRFVDRCVGRCCCYNVVC